jgi:hypothetical protein
MPPSGDSVLQALSARPQSAAAAVRRAMVHARARAGVAAPSDSGMSKSSDDCRSAAEPRHLHRSEKDGGAVDPRRAAAVDAVHGHRLLHQQQARFANESGQAGENGRKPEGAAAIRIVRVLVMMWRALAAVVVLVRGLLIMIGVMVHGPVRVNVDMGLDLRLGLRERDLLGDLIEAIGRDGAIGDGERQRGRNQPGEIQESNGDPDATPCPAHQ